MKVAILGLGTVGFGVYDIIAKSSYLNDVEVKYILDKDSSKQELVKSKVTSSIDEILNDKEVEVVIECMGAKDFSYKCIKNALLASKSVVTANKEVIAEHIKELTEIKKEKNVSLYYEASVGGGIPIIKPLHNAALVNEVSEIKGILNGTTNYILTKMSKEGLSFEEALKLAQINGFAEADPTADLEGLDMVRKIAILSSIGYKTEIDPEKVSHFGISNLSDKDIKYAEKYNSVIKLIASSKVIDDKVELKIEPVFIEKGSMIASVNYEFNVIEVKTNINDKLTFMGKGAGRYPTANAMVNDLIMIKHNDKNYSFNEECKKEYKDLGEKYSYYIRLKDGEQICNCLIKEQEGNQLITKEIEKAKLNELMEKVSFYARIGE